MSYCYCEQKIRISTPRSPPQRTGLATTIVEANEVGYSGCGIIAITPPCLICQALKSSPVKDDGHTAQQGNRRKVVAAGDSQATVTLRALMKL